MAKLLLLTGLLLLFVSCNEKPECESQSPASLKQEQNPNTACPSPQPEPTPDPVPEPGPGEGEEVPHEALIFDAKLNLFEFDRTDEDKIFKAIEVIKNVVGSKEFRDRVLNFTYQGKKQFVDNKGLTNAEIYQVLLDGKEDLRPEIDHEMDLELQLYYSWTSTVGYTTPGELRIYMNTKFFDSYTPAEVAGNVFHEWTHKLGFTHDSSYSVSRDSSVPYAIGYLIRDLGRQYE